MASSLVQVTAQNKMIPSLSQYHLSEEIGFLLERPLEQLPEYFGPWNYLGHRVDELIRKAELRKCVAEMPLLDHTKLQGYRQWRLAHTYLSFIGNAYIWQDGDKGLNQRAFPQFPGGESSKWFFLISVQVEFDALPGIKAMLRAMQGVVNDDYQLVLDSLTVMTRTLHVIKSTVSRLHDLVDASVFYNEIRPYLSGWGGAGSYVPDGLIYEGVSDVPIKVIGASAAQSAAVQCFDAALGIIHEPSRKIFLDTMRTYMPPAHAEFIAALENGPSIRRYVETSANVLLKDSFEQCVSALRDFRSYHLQIVTKYVVCQSNKESLADGTGQRGTGGTDILPFLKGIRDTTVTNYR